MNPDLNSASNSEFDDVLLTAYLDNEVTDAERARVEEQLRTSQASRQLLEELRSVRNLVSQLHSSQPIRSFEQGPWSKTKEPEESHRVELSHDRPAWRVSYQRFASLAAMIAVAACLSVLVLGPNRKSMSLSESSSPNVASATPARKSMEAIPGGSNDTASSALSVSPENLDRPASGAGGFGSPPSGMTASSPKSKSIDSKLADPAPAATMKGADSDAAAMKPGIAQAAVQASQPPSSNDNFYFGLNLQNPDGLSDWLLINGPSAITTLGARQVPANVLSEKESEARSDQSPMRARFTYRFIGEQSKEAKQSADGSASADTTPPPFTRLELSRGSNDEQIADDSNPLEFELQVPEEGWEKGAMRLRQLGIEVPLELPQVEQLDYIATKLPGDVSGLFDITQVDSEHKPLEPMLAKDDGVNRFNQESKPVESNTRVRIRVRIMKKVDR